MLGDYSVGSTKNSCEGLIGQTLKGTYRITEYIAKGGMGVVYRALELSSQRTVVIKTMVQANPELNQRFIREAKILNQLDHPNIVQLFDFGTTAGGVLFMVLEHLTGGTLEQIVPKGKGLAVKQAVALLAQICSAVGTAHKARLVHRDLKPSNIFLARSSKGAAVIKVLDFGIAKCLDATDTALTQAGIPLGSCGYMAPEQIRGDTEIDCRADIYALGGLLYYVLTGAPAFQGKNVAQILTKQLMCAPDPVDFAALANVGASAVMPVVLKAMHPELSMRFQSAAEFMKSLWAAAGASAADIAGVNEELAQLVPNRGASPATLTSSSSLAETTAPPSKAPPERAAGRGHAGWKQYVKGI